MPKHQSSWKKFTQHIQHILSVFACVFVSLYSCISNVMFDICASPSGQMSSCWRGAHFQMYLSSLSTFFNLNTNFFFKCICQKHSLFTLCFLSNCKITYKWHLCQDLYVNFFSIIISKMTMYINILKIHWEIRQHFLNYDLYM